MDIPPQTPVSPLSPPPPAAPQPPPTTGPSLPKIPVDLDPRTIATMKWSAVWNAVGGAIVSVTGDILRTFGGVTQNFPIGELIKDILWGAVYGAVFGFLISKFYTQIQQWNRQYLKGRLNTFFKLLFYPSLVGSLLAFLMTSAAGFGIGFMPLIIILAGVLLKGFVYAKMMTKYVGQLYPPPV